MSIIISGGGGGGGGATTLSGLTDVTIAALANGQILSYNNVSGQWENQTGITGGLTYKGSFNATTGAPSIANAVQGDFYVISVGGTLYGQNWVVGDHLLINADMGGVIDNAKIDKVDNTDQVVSVNTRTGAVTGLLDAVNNLSDLVNVPTARTNLGLGTAATSASSDFLAVANNLSDLGDAATARTNLGLGTAATSASTDFLAAANNLSDLGDAATARTNLGLGTAATAASTDFLSGTGADTLGGNLDVGSSSIVSSGAANIAITPDTTGSIVLDGLSWPQADGTPGQVIQTDGAGQLSFTTVSAGGSRPTVTTDSSGTNSTISNPAASVLEDIYLVDNGVAAVTITLPTVTGNSGYKAQIKRLGTANVTISPASGTIDNAPNQVLSSQYASFTVTTDGSNWFII